VWSFCFPDEENISRYSPNLFPGLLSGLSGTGWHENRLFINDSLLGWFNGKPENIPIVPDPGNSGEGIKKENLKGFWLTLKPFVFLPGF
jgi:hypothetical protein